MSTSQTLFESNATIGDGTSLAVRFAQLALTDPIMFRLYQGKQQWGEVPFEDWELELAATQPYVRLYDPNAPKVVEEEPVEKPLVMAVSQVALPAGSVGIKTLMAKNLPRDITVEKLRSIFEVHGPLRDIYIPKNMDKSSPYFGTIKGFAKVQYLKPEDSAKAYQAEFGRLQIGSNKIVIEFAKEDR
jgi:RNA recognition motif-containing protein